MATITRIHARQFRVHGVRLTLAQAAANALDHAVAVERAKVGDDLAALEHARARIDAVIASEPVPVDHTDVAPAPTYDVRPGTPEGEG